MRDPKTQASYYSYRDTLPKDKCHFCKIGPGNKIIEKTMFWTIIDNKFKWLICKEQLVVISRFHFLNNGKIPWYKKILYWLSLIELLRIRKQYKDYTILHNGYAHESVSHLHYQILKWRDLKIKSLPRKASSDPQRWLVSTKAS